MPKELKLSWTDSGYTNWQRGSDIAPSARGRTIQVCQWSEITASRPPCSDTLVSPRIAGFVQIWFHLRVCYSAPNLIFYSHRIIGSVIESCGDNTRAYQGRFLDSFVGLGESSVSYALSPMWDGTASKKSFSSRIPYFQ